MRFIGYANMAHINEHSSNVVKELSEHNCSVVHLETQNESEKNEWNYFIDELREGDAAVLYSFCNVFQDFTEMMFFLKMCSAKRIRIVSIHDEIDSSDNLTSDTLSAISKVTNIKRENTHDDFQAEFMTGNKRDKKLKKHRMIINMYNAGFSIKDIMAKTGYKTKSNIYRILHAYDIPLEYPTMSRKSKSVKMRENNSTTTNHTYKSYEENKVQ